MLVRRPPRRVSRRTRQRYSAIRKFFRRALGSISRPSTSIILSDSNYTVNDLKHRIIDLEQTLSEITKRYPNISTLIEKVSPRTDDETTAESLGSSNDKDNNIKKIQYSFQSTTNSSKNSLKPETNCSKLHEDKQGSLDVGISPRKSKRNKHVNNIVTASKCDETNYITPLLGKNIESVFSTSSPDTPQQSSLGKLKRRSKHHQTKIQIPLDEKKIDALCDFLHDKDIQYAPKNLDHNKSREIKYKSLSHGRQEHNIEKLEKRTKVPKQRSELTELDQTFITEIIRKQYRPVKLGRRNSEMSQFTVPVCRDRVSRSKATRVNDSNESSCFVHTNLCKCEEDNFNEEQDVYDSKYYKCSSLHRPKHKSKHPHVYDDSALYDLVPVKEKPEPPSACKFTLPEEKRPIIPYKEVPPSPRSQRPRLNLTANYSDYEEVQDIKPDVKTNVTDCFNTLVSKLNLANLSNQPSDNTANNSNEVTKSDVFNKTEETLLEIKETLVQFLEDFKKENSVHNLQEKCCAGVSSSCLMHKYPFGASNVMQPMIPNSCYYPMAMPICPISCVPNTSTAPNNCNFTSSKDNIKKEDQSEKKTDKDSTVELIKEIYKCVAPKTEPGDKSDLDLSKQENQETKIEPPQPDVKILTSRSVGSSRVSLNEPDNNQYLTQSVCRSSSFGTLNTKITTNLYEDLRKELYYSDTHINTSEADITQEKPQSSGTTLFEKKPKKNTFKKILKTLNFMANKKGKASKNTDSSEVELSKEELTTIPSKTVPYSHSVINYQPYGQSYVAYPAQRPTYQTGNYRHSVYSSSSDRGMSSMHSYVKPTAPPFAMSFTGQNVQPGFIPMRTKQIELKCTATQSETIPFYHKVAKLFHTPKAPNISDKEDAPNNYPVASVTAPANFTSLHPISQMPRLDKQLFDWKKLQSKIMKPEMDLKTMSYMQKDNLMFQQTNKSLQKELLKKLGQTSKNPLSVKHMIKKALLTNTKSHQKMLFKPKFLF